jgi:hypothetical protein
MTILQELQNKLKHNKERLKWEQEIDFSRMSPVAKSFSAGQSQAWVGEIYFLKRLIEKIGKEVGPRDIHHY